MDRVIREALENCERWTGGAVIIRSEPGDYAAYPGAYMDDVSFSRRGDEVVYRIERLEHLTGDARAWDELGDDEHDWAVEQAHLAICAESTRPWALYAGREDNDAQTRGTEISGKDRE